MRSCIGSMQHFGSNTWPDICAATSLIQNGAPMIEDLSAVYDCIDYLRDTADCGITVKPLELDQLIVVGYGDSSWGNAEGLRTQTGILVIAAERRALLGESPGNILDWKSNRTARVVRSTLAGEAIATDTAADATYHAAAAFSEPQPVPRMCRELRSIFSLADSSSSATRA